MTVLGHEVLCFASIARRHRVSEDSDAVAHNPKIQSSQRTRLSTIRLGVSMSIHLDSVPFQVTTDEWTRKAATNDHPRSLQRFSSRLARTILAT